MANAATVSIVLGLDGVNTVMAGLNRVNAGLGAVGRGVGGLAAGVGTAIIGGVAAGAVALGGLGAVVGKTGTDFLAMKEQALVAFTTMLGSASAGQSFFAELQRFAATTPFELPGVTQSAQHLLAVGFAAKDIIPDLTAIGNAVSATGAGQAGMDRVILALGQMKAKGKVQGDEMLQLTENNISAWQYLAAYLGTDVPTAMKRVTKGLVTGDQGVQAILAGLNHDPKFAGMMENQSHTFIGLVSNMHDYWNQFAGAIAQPIFDRALKPGLEWLTGWLSGPGLALGARLGAGLAGGLARASRVFGDFRDRLTGGFRDLSRAGGALSIGAKLADGFLRIRAAVTDHIVPAVQLLWRTFGGGAAAGGLLGGILGGLIRVIELGAGGFQLGVDAVVTFKQALQGVWNGTAGGNAFVEMVGRIGNALRAIGLAFQTGGVGAALSLLWSQDLQPALIAAWNGLTGWIAEKVPLFAGLLGEWAGAFGGWASGIWTAHLWPGLQQMWTDFNTWVGTNTPTIIATLAQWGAAFGTWALGAGQDLAGKLMDGINGLLGQRKPLTALGQGMLGDMNGVPQQSGGGGILGFLDALGAAITLWANTTGKATMGAAFKALFVGEGEDGKGGNDQGGIANWLNGLNTNISTWGATTGHKAMTDALNAIFVTDQGNGKHGALATWLDNQAANLQASFGPVAESLGKFFGDSFVYGLWLQLPDWAKTILGISGLTPAVPTAPNLTPAGGTGHELTPIGGGGGAGNITINVTTTGPTTEELAQSMADQLYAALHPVLTGGDNTGNK